MRAGSAGVTNPDPEPITDQIIVTRPPRPEDYQSPRWNASAAVISFVFTALLILAVCLAVRP